jgi:sugar/nucleoside kinase (ribokinase family)
VIFVLGDVNVDVVAAHDGPIAPHSDTHASIALRPGGQGANVAAWIAKAGARVTLIGRIGSDPLAEVALQGLENVNLHLTRDRERATGTCIVLVAPGGERTMLPDPGANDALTADDLPELDGEILHVSGYSLLRPGSRPAALEAIDRAHARGMKISVDPASAVPLANDPVFLARIAPIDLLLPNQDEAAVLGPQIDVPELVITRGRDGATWTDHQTKHQQAALNRDDVVDTTGAGDAFAAGFLSAWRGGDPQQALLRGAELAAQAIAQRGGRPL